MFKKLYTGSALVICAAAFAQVGINTDTPAATFDVVGKPTVTSALDGIIAPRIDGAQLRAKAYTAAQTGALVYVTGADTAPAGQTVNVTSTGYYYFDGSVWIKSASDSGSGSDADGVIGNEVLNATPNGGLVRAGIGTTADPYTLGLTAGTTAGDLMTWNGTAWIPNAAQNIYNTNGSLTSFRTLNLNSHSLLFTGQNQSTLFAEDGVTQSGLTGPAVIKLQAADVNGNGETTRFAIQANEDDYVSLYSNGESKGITIETADTTGPSFIEFRTTTGPGNNQRMLITGSGNTGINTNYPSEKLDLNGISRIRQLPLDGSTNAINTNSSGNASSAQDQTFTATRTVVADANGVLGSVIGLPLTTEVDGVIGNEVLNATNNGGLVRAGGGTAASPYTLGLIAGSNNGDVMTWNGTAWSPAATTAALNIYNSDGSLTANRTLTNAGSSLTFLGANQSTRWSSTGALTQRGIGTSSKRASISLVANDGDANGTTSNLFYFQDPELSGQITVSGDSRGLIIGPTSTTQAAPLSFTTSAGSLANGTEKMRITPTGNVGIATNAPTETLHVNGITRLQGLPQNGAANAIYTTSGGTASATQNQTFTATRTVVADANGVLGYVTGVPTGTTRVVVSAGAIGNQNIGNANMLLSNYPNEYIDTYNAFASNVFTVPSGMSGLYSFSMQSAHAHDVNGQTDWFVSAILQKSTDNGSSYNIIMKDTNAGMPGTVADNGNAINWTGNLNAGDKIRLLYHSNSTASNYVYLGSITITQIAQ